MLEWESAIDGFTGPKADLSELGHGWFADLAFSTGSVISGGFDECPSDELFRRLDCSLTDRDDRVFASLNGRLNGPSCDLWREDVAEAVGVE